mgnify:CR=1 FL=1
MIIVLTNLKRITFKGASVPHNIGKIYTCNEYRWINDIDGMGSIETNMTSESDIIEYALMKALQNGNYSTPTEEEIEYLRKYL